MSIMKMKKLSSSSRRESKRKLEKFHCHPNSKTVGCVSGIFRFFAGRHSSSCKRLPSASTRKDEPRISPSKTLPSTSEKKETASLPFMNEVGVSVEARKDASHSMTVAQTATAFLRNLHLRRQSYYSCKVALHSSAIRRPPSSLDAADSPRRPTTLVERLMGLDEFPVSSPETTAGKERKLLGAVQNCEDRLKSLKKIIAAVRAAESGRKKAAEALEWIKVDNVGSDRTCHEESEDGDSSMETVKSMDGNREQPSPVSVLLDATISPTKFSSNRSEHEIESEAQITRTQPSEVGVISSAGKCNKGPGNSVVREVTMEGLPRMLKENEFKAPLRPAARRRRLWRHWTRSRAMAETVCEVMERSRWEERKEAGKVAVALERGIFGDLVDELGRDLALHCKVVSTRGERR